MEKNRLDLEYHHQPAPEETAIGLWVESVGHYRQDDHVMPGRIRDDFFLMYCVEGGGTYRWDGHDHPIQAGDLYLAPPDIVHVWTCDRRTGWEVWWAHFQGDQARRLARLLNFSLARWTLPLGVRPELTRPFKRLLATLRDKKPHCGLDASMALFELLVTARKLTAPQAIGDDQLHDALLGNPRSIEEMARAAHMSKFHFIRKFREATGVTPWRYILNRRLSRAKELLCDPRLSIKEVALQLGFENPNYFSRLFHRQTGQSASAFRRRNAIRPRKE
jgi:AraC-like DNA-binding protein